MDYFKKYSVKIVGETPLLMHSDNLQWTDVIKQWQSDPANRKLSIAGDDRSPPWTWIGSLYTEYGKVVIPSDNLMTVMREGGKRVPTGKRQGTFKSQSQSGIVIDQTAWPLVVKGKTIPYEPIEALIENMNFLEHEKVATDLGFQLFTKRAKIGRAKHVRVRPRFDPPWEASGTATVLDEAISEEIFRNIWTFAGAYSGIGDWRPSSPSAPGSFGKFTCEIKEVS